MTSNVIKKYARTIAHALCAGLIAAAAIAPANALADATPSVLGKTIGEWSAQWWKWAYSIPTPFNPMLDTSGAYCDVGQKGPMWFLAGWFFGDGTPVVRACSVPRGKYILFPIISATWIQTLLDDPTLKETDWRRLANEFLPPSVGGDMEATLDGEPIIFNPKTPITQSQSPVFEATFPEDNVYSAFGYLATDLTDQPIVSDGWWVVLPPLAPGEHVLHFRAGQSQQNVTYHLTVGKRQHH
jgi:hypothetical protein